MQRQSPHNLLNRRAVNHARLAQSFSREPQRIPELFGGLGAEKATVRFGSLKVLRLLSEKQPGLLYPYFEQLLPLLRDPNKVLQWGAILIIGNLASVDTEGKIDAVLDSFLKPLGGPVMITAANTIGAAAKIARAKPALAGRIARAFLRVEKANYQTAECRNVALGHVITACDTVFSQLKKPEPVLALVTRQLKNSRPAVRRKAAAFLKKTRPVSSN